MPLANFEVSQIDNNEINWEKWRKKYIEKYGQTDDEIDQIIKDQFGSKDENTTFNAPE